jgi:hypothetical protein
MSHFQALNVLENLLMLCRQLPSLPSPLLLHLLYYKTGDRKNKKELSKKTPFRLQ